MRTPKQIAEDWALYEGLAGATPPGLNASQALRWWTDVSGKTTNIVWDAHDAWMQLAREREARERRGK